MLKISKGASVNVSLCAAVAFIVTFAAFAVVLPFVWEDTPYFSDFINGIEANNSALHKEMFFAWLYTVICVAEICCVAVVLLLLRVRKGLVFTEASISYIRFVSWGCVFLALVGMVGQLFHPLMFILALAAAFLGLCLRVVKNVIEEATAIKNENDFTV